MLAIIPRTNEERNKTLKFPPRFKLIYAKQASPFLLTEIMVLFYTSVLIHSFIHSDNIVGKPSRGDTMVGEPEKVCFGDLQSAGGRATKNKYTSHLKKKHEGYRKNSG